MSRRNRRSSRERRKGRKRKGWSIDGGKKWPPPYLSHPTPTSPRTSSPKQTHHTAQGRGGRAGREATHGGGPGLRRGAGESWGRERGIFFCFRFFFVFGIFLVFARSFGPFPPSRNVPNFLSLRTHHRMTSTAWPTSSLRSSPPPARPSRPTGRPSRSSRSSDGRSEVVGDVLPKPVRGGA